MIDLHLHVWPHQPGTPTPTFEQLEQYCDTAASRGITEIAITEHSYRFNRIIEEVLPHWDRPKTGPVADATAHVLQAESGADLDAYVEALQNAQQAGLPILVGLEVDYLPGAMSATAALLDEYPFDVLLGSVHWLDEWLFDDYGTDVFARRWIERNTDEVYAQYVDAICELVEANVVDVLAHLDVIKVAGYRPSNIAEHECRLVEVLADANVAVEFSSAGLHKPGAETYPSPSLLDALVSKGVALTTASDAHTVDQVGRGFNELASALEERGVQDLVTFRRRQRVAYPLQLSDRHGS